MKVSAPTGRLANRPARSPKRVERGVCTSTIDTAPIATPMTARSTTGATFRRTATGWETATTTSRVARTARNRTISSIEAEAYPVAASGGKIASDALGPAAAVRPAFRLVGAKIDEHASAAQRLPGQADVAAVQDQPMMGVDEEPVRDDAHESLLDLARRFAGRDGEPVGDAEDVGVDGQRRLAEHRVEHHIGGLAANARQGLERLATARRLAAVPLHDRARQRDD